MTNFESEMHKIELEIEYHIKHKNKKREYMNRIRLDQTIKLKKMVEKKIDNVFNEGYGLDYFKLKKELFGDNNV